ncbi:hypothetical protein ACFL2V_03475 [Pseudomonadota bacterium]
MSANQEILAGPILRRCDKTQVNVWIATSVRPAQLKCEIFNEDRLLSSSSFKTVKLGEHLFVNLISARPTADRFPEDALLNYDLMFNNEDLNDLGLTSGNDSIVYGDQSLPGFIIASASSNLTRRVFHGSCRKLHGEGRDALALADEELNRYSADPQMRPSALFLTGDQIYADDVAAPLIKSLSALAETMCPNEPAVPDMPWPPSSIAINKRHTLMDRKAAFTSSAAENHLISFGEYAAMHLMSWSGASWPDKFESDVDVIKDRIFHPFHISKETTKARAAYRKQVKYLDLNRQTLPNVRRVLANVPSYMILDDHEVTDDWNLSRSWVDDVNNSAAGPRIINNALAAYWAFQGWGNEPQNDNNSELIAALESYLNTSSPSDRESARFNDAIKAHDWSYVAPTQPPALVLDTRTHRNMNVEDDEMPWLINQERLGSMTRQLSSFDGYSQVLVVSAAPVVGIETVEEGQAMLSELGDMAISLDFECWSASPMGLAQFFKHLHNAAGDDQTLIFLSGDVHYTFNMSGSFKWQDEILNFKQITSSAQKNTGWANRKVMKLAAALDGQRTLYGWDERPTSNYYENVVKRNPSNYIHEFTQYPRLLNQTPLLLSEGLKNKMDIEENCDWEIRSDYLKMTPDAHDDDHNEEQRIVGHNNIGCLTFDGNGSLSNTTFAWCDDDARAYTVDFPADE